MATEIHEQAAESILGANPFVGIDTRRLALDLVGLAGRAATRPAAVARALGAIRDVRPADGDRRFADPAWRDNPAYSSLLKTYLSLTAASHRLVDEVGLRGDARERAHFAVELVADALAPTNALHSNPAALKRAFETGGRSLLRGGRHLLGDLQDGGMPVTVDARPFSVGGTVAVSPGGVVHRDEVLELIQYTPVTGNVFERPLVVVPPQINKFYVLDLAPGRSFTEYAVARGIPYFAISWRNPTPAQREWGLDRYVRACLDAFEIAAEIAGADSVNTMGICAGGVTLSLALGHLAAAGRADLVSSATLAVAMLDLDSPSLMNLFASDGVIAAALRKSRARGVLDGAEMARVFAWMRPNDLVWNYWVNNYLMGNDPPAFDILAWNADTTRLPAQLHADFLDLYARNPLPKAGAATVLDTPVDLSQVRCPTYTVAGITDHIVPWRAGYRTGRLFGGSNEFVLSSSGHIQSIVNSPGNPKAAYFAGGPDGEDDADAWLRGATKRPGSWWEHWAGWISRHSGASHPAAKRLGSRRHRRVGEAPGRYVLER